MVPRPQWRRAGHVELYNARACTSAGAWPLNPSSGEQLLLGAQPLVAGAAPVDRPVDVGIEAGYRVLDWVSRHRPGDDVAADVLVLERSGFHTVAVLPDAVKVIEGDVRRLGPLHVLSDATGHRVAILVHPIAIHVRPLAIKEGAQAVARAVLEGELLQVASPVIDAATGPVGAQLASRRWHWRVRRRRQGRGRVVDTGRVRRRRRQGHRARFRVWRLAAGDDKGTHAVSRPQRRRAGHVDLDGAGACAPAGA